MSDITLAFLLLVALNFGVRYWLSSRQIQSASGHRHKVPIAFDGTLSLNEHQKAADYTCAKMRLAQIQLVIETCWLLTLTLGGGINLLYDMGLSWATHWFSGDSPLLSGLIFLGLLGFASGLVDLPFTLYRQFVLEARFGFNRMTLHLFFLDMIRGTLVGVIIGLPIILLLLWLLQHAGPTSWFWAWLAWMGFNGLVLFIYPVLVAPLFNKFTPMPDSPHKTKLESLLHRCNFSAGGLFVMDGSKRSAHANAYFTGFGRHRRIVLFDTLLDQLSPDQLEAVLAHEIGHYKRHHLPKRLAIMAVVSLTLLWILFQLLQAPWFYTDLGVAHANPATAIALFSMTMPLCMLPLTPIANALSRKHEYEADAFAAGQTRSRYLIDALLTLYRENAATLTPDRLFSLFHDSHPPATLRIQHLAQYQPDGQ